jgi:hypothetical protein
MKNLATLVLAGSLLNGYSYGQAKPQGHVTTKEQPAQAEEAAKAKALRSSRTAALVVHGTTSKHRGLWERRSPSQENLFSRKTYSHSIVPGGLEVMS